MSEGTVQTSSAGLSNDPNQGHTSNREPRTFAGIPAFLPWWWMLVLFGGIGLGASQLLWARFVPSPFLTDSLAIQIIGGVGFLIFAVLWISLMALTFVIAPILSAKDRDPVFRVPPAWHLNTLQWIVSAPAFIVAIVGIYDSFERSIDHFLSTGEILIFRVPQWAWFYIPIFMVTVVYAWAMHPWLRRRLVDSTRWRGVCFHCGYDLRSQAEIMLIEELDRNFRDNEGGSGRAEPTSSGVTSDDVDLNVRCSECGESNPVPRSIVKIEPGKDEIASEVGGEQSLARS